MGEGSEKRPRWTWWVLILFAGVVLLVSGVFTPSSVRPIAYADAVALVQTGQVESATVGTDEVVLRKRPVDRKPAERVSTARMPGVAQEPLLQALLASGVRLETESTRPMQWTQALSWVVPFVLLNALFFLAMRRMGQERMQGPMAFLRNRTKLYDRAKQQAVRFSDVAGVEEAKLELVEVVDFLKNPARYRALGGRIPRGLLLIGPPGTGKTLLARAVAGEASAPFYSLNASEFVEMFVGLGAARVRELFDQAKRTAPSIVFIDEIDAVGRARGGVSTISAHDEREQTLHQLLAELDGFDERTTVILMAATNRPEVLDAALLRPGRFDRQVIVDRPDLRGREAILRVHAGKLPLGTDVDLGAVARRTPGMAGADLANVVNEAALSGARRGADRVGAIDFAEALDRVQLGLKRKGILMTPAERRRIAYHEAGHALVALALPDADPVERVSIVARTIGALGMTIQVPRDERHVVTEHELLTRITVLLAGRAAEELEFHDISSGAHDDLGRATQLLHDMVTRLGMSRRLGLPTLSRVIGAPLLGVTQEERLCSETTAREIDEELRERIEECYSASKELLQSRREALATVAEALLTKETLSGEELHSMVGASSMLPSCT